jgi:O-antigen ligase
MKNKIIIIFAVIINIFLIILRFQVGPYYQSSGANLLGIIIFLTIAFMMFLTFINKNYDYFIIIWLTYYFAAPIVKPPFFEIGSLGLLNIVFIPLMLLTTFNFKNKYFINILLLVFISILHVADVNLRILISRVFLFITPFVFFYFVTVKCKNKKLILWSSIIITLVNVPLGIYEYFAHPVWGVEMDPYRGARILGNLFWPNSYSFYLLPSLMILYGFFRTKKSWRILLYFLILVIMNVLTASRGGIMAFLLGIVVFEFYNKGLLKITKEKIIIIFLIILLFGAYNHISVNLDKHYTPDTISERTTIWETIIPFIEGNLLFGNGLGSYEIFRHNFLNSLSSHNIYLNVIFELGLVGLILILSFIGFIFMKFQRMTKNIKTSMIGRIGISIIVSILFYSMVGNAAFSQVVALNTWIILGCFVNYNEKNQDIIYFNKS